MIKLNRIVETWLAITHTANSQMMATPSNNSAILNRLGIRRKISKKIGYGYAIAIGMAIIGTSTGLLIGSYYSRKAQARADVFTQKQELLEMLNSQVLGLQLHPSRLLAVNSLWREYEINQFTLDINHLKDFLAEIEQFAIAHGLGSRDQISLTTLSQEYGDVLEGYEGFIAALWEQTDPNDLSEATVTVASAIATILSTEESSELSLKFETLSEDLVRLRQSASLERQLATVQLQQAEKLRLTIIITSIVLSTGIAIFLAAITSRTIARPIETVPAVAHQVTKSADFSLQAPITTHDEVALLAQALNQLITWTGHYTEELELARDTLEQRVQERTQALQESETQQRQQAESLRQTLSELQQTQLKLVQSEKMASLGQMVAGIAHEINNPVSFIYGNLAHIQANTEDLFHLLTQYQRHYPNPVHEIQEEIDAIELDFLSQDFPNLMASVYNGAERIRDIVKSLRTFSRLDESSLKTVNIHEGLDSTLTILQNRLRGDRYHPPIHVHKDYGQLPLIECHAGQINQVFMNIISNAIDAIQEIYPAKADLISPGGSTESQHIGQDRASSSIPQITIQTQHNQEGIEIRITDNGPGVKADALQKLFDPFFTTKEVGKGTGLGLSISYQIVTQTHQGSLVCDSTVGKGTTFIIRLPVQHSSSS